jgi:hypothetical protein
MAKHDYYDDDINEQDEEQAEGGRRKGKKRKRYGDGWIIFLFVVAIGCLMMGALMKVVASLLVGAVFLVIGIIALLRPNRIDGANGQVWRCGRCGWVFETTGKKRRSLVTRCPHCGEKTKCTPVRR